MLPSYLHNNVFSAPNWTFVHGFCVLVPNYVANHVVFWSNFCRESRCFGDTFRPLKKVLVTQKGFFAGLPQGILSSGIFEISLPSFQKAGYGPGDPCPLVPSLTEKCELEL